MERALEACVPCLLFAKCQMQCASGLPWPNRHHHIVHRIIIVVVIERWRRAHRGCPRPATSNLVNQTMGLLDAGQVRRILYEALDLWSRHANISFRETYSTEADIQVMFARKFHGDGYNFDGPGKILAHAFYPGTGIGGDAHFDEEESWLLNEPLDAEGTRLFDVALHEFGHSLGLGHSSQQNAIMFPWHHISYRGKDTIPEDDRLGIESIYGPRTKRYGVNPERHTPRTSTTTTTIAPTPPPRPTTRPHYPSKGVPGHPREGYPNRVPNYPRTTSTTTTEMPRSREYYPSYGNRHPIRHHTTTQVVPTATTNHHRPHHHPHHRPATPTRRTTQHHGGPTPPNACNTSFDAITMIRNELFVFKDRWLWRMEQKKTSDGVVEAHRPPVAYEINRLFFGLPDDFERIDTVYENKYQKIIFFIGKQYFVFNSQNIEPGYPRPLTDLGLPESIERIDAALVWSHNNRTYLYSGRLYWRFDEDTNKVELDYPRDMSIWKGIGYNIDAAFQYSDGKTYFFKGLGYWRFNDMRMRVSHDQQPSATRWMRCPNERQVQNDLDDPSEPTDWPDRDLPPRIDTSRGASRWSCYNLALLLLSLSLIAMHHP
ncbi:matrix metalloproteinase-24-like isoform X2 [Anopheles albimanus]|uniref:matrix metalloproteinase-24-like isoform X2 n=1 Tax=Anopheles albimanus TaxID=7167 RepID=UPI00163FC546|nr:matrix metalloproteinase-24-like isoform X2 [Anopheles albimanus]